MKKLQGIELVKTAGLKFKIIQHDDVTAALRPLFIEHGIVQEVSITESRDLPGGTTELLVKVSWINADEPTDRRDVISVGHASSNYVKDGVMRRDDLGVGKALSYAVKMAQLKNFALLSGDEDLEQEQAKPAAKQETMASTDEVERVMNQLASATTPAEFSLAADACASIAGRITSEQTGLMGKAWKAAKDRTSNGTPNQPLPAELGEAPAQKVDPSVFADLQIEYSKVRSQQELSAVRQKAGPLAKTMSPAQRQIMKETDDSIVRLLAAQQDAAR